MSSSSLERTIDKVLSQAESEFISQIDSAFGQAKNDLDASRTKLQSEYEVIVESAKKQAENLKRQIIGSSRLNARNKELLIIESAINEIFDKAKERLQSKPDEKSYKELIRKMVEDSVSKLESTEIIIECNKNDYDLLKKVIQDISGKNTKIKLSISKKPIDISGGIRARSGDGTMTLDNSMESRIERLKPLIRKEIVQLLRSE
jgi:V/A-type H+/Na+-transporting ATPase subunit E